MQAEEVIEMTIKQMKREAIKRGLWLAQYKVKRPTYEGKYDAWQYSSKGRVDGIEGNVDLDVVLKL